MNRMWLIAFLVAAIACSSHPRSEDVRTVTIEGVFLELDEPNGVIVLQRSGGGERLSHAAIHYDAMTPVDFPDRSGKVYDLEFGDRIVVYGLEDIETGEITADRIHVLEGRRR